MPVRHRQRVSALAVSSRGRNAPGSCFDPGPLLMDTGQAPYARLAGVSGHQDHSRSNQRSDCVHQCSVITDQITHVCTAHALSLPPESCGRVKPLGLNDFPMRFQNAQDHLDCITINRDSSDSLFTIHSQAPVESGA